MSLQINDLVVESTLSASTMTATTLYVGNNNIGSSSSSFSTLSATTFSAGTIYSAGTDLYNIFLTTNDGNDITRVQPGLNTYTGGTGNNPTVNISAATLATLTVSGNTSLGVVSATTIYSGSTNLYDIFLTTGTLTPTYVQNGLNTYTGGTITNPTINVSALTINTIFASGSSVFTGGLSANTLSGGTILSGSTNLYSIFHDKNGYKLQKAGNISGASFAGNPKKYTLTFTTPFADTNYAISISSDTNRTWTWESKTASGFTINANSNTTFNAGSVNWIAQENGEGYI